MKRNMKRIGIVWLILLSLCACAKPAEQAEVSEPAAETSDRPVLTVDEAAGAILISQGYEDMTALTGDTLTAYLTGQYGLEENGWTEAAVYIAAGVDAREIAVIRVADWEEGRAVVDALNTYKESRRGDFYGYAPEQAALVEQGFVMQSDDTLVTLLICAAPYKALDALWWAQDAPAQTPEDDSVSDSSGYVPFNPPNEHDMSLYDTSSIVTAYTTGEESGLNEKDAAILGRCREVLAQCLTGSMTDFEKEVALHGWLMEHGEYDWTTYDRSTPQGREDNTNPYGMLVRGYGICLGYAATFQLLMELAGVECVVVVGASSNSTEDHAWNMVRLEGEWYCVDPTWNSNSSFWNYFNVTSAYMRLTDHQWDYQNVPEATATRFCWNKEGELPA